VHILAFQSRILVPAAEEGWFRQGRLSFLFGVSDFKNLKVWRKAHALALNVHSAVAGIRGPNHVGLRSQLIRASMAIPTNIVEGTGQKSKREFGRFVRFALNSTSELEYRLIVARDTQAITHGDFDRLSTQMIEVRKMLHGLLRHLDMDLKNGATERQKLSTEN
jgi:four helix bundle protein